MVNDGSTDGTADIINRYATHPQITALHKENGGKFTAMNLGIAHAGGAEFIGFLDADSFVAPDALTHILAAFDAPTIAAVTASMSINTPKTLMQRMQYAEYALSITVRHALASLNGLYVTPGPFSFYRASALAELGAFKHAHQAEDMEMAMRIQRKGLRIGNAVHARVYTNGPATLPKLIKQRTRWTTGFLRNVLFDYRDLLGHRKNPLLGLFVLPFALFAVFSGIFLFGFILVETFINLLHTFSIVSAAPAAYAFSPHAINLLYLPITATTLFTLVLLTSALSWMALGKHISRTPGRLLPNLPAYFLLYSFVVPIWLINSVSQVARGTRMTWR